MALRMRPSGESRVVVGLDGRADSRGGEAGDGDARDRRRSGEGESGGGELGKVLMVGRLEGMVEARNGTGSDGRGPRSSFHSAMR